MTDLLIGRLRVGLTPEGMLTYKTSAFVETSRRLDLAFS